MTAIVRFRASSIKMQPARKQYTHRAIAAAGVVADDPVCNRPRTSTHVFWHVCLCVCGRGRPNGDVSCQREAPLLAHVIP